MTLARLFSSPVLEFLRLMSDTPSLHALHILDVLPAEQSAAVGRLRPPLLAESNLQYSD